MKRKKMTGTALAALTALLSGGILTAAPCMAETASAAETEMETEAEAEDPWADGSYFHITYDDKEYTYNSQIITVLYAGVDSDDELETYNRYSIAPRADAIELVIFDDYNKTISILAVSRDTVESVARYTMNGDYRDNYDTNIGFAFSYGNGGVNSCENLVESVETLIKGIPVHEYVVTNNGSIGELNDLVGGVTVMVPNDDLAEMYSGFKTGAVVTLNAQEAIDFTRWRDVEIEFSNNGRMERQKAFSSAFFKAFIGMVKNDPDKTWDQIEDFSDIYLTSITRNQYLDLADRLDTETFSADQYYTLEGENVYDEERGVDVFYVDEDNLAETLVKLFYLEDEQ